MSELQKYILGADIGNDCAMIRPFDNDGWTGEWERYNAGIMCKAEDVDAARAADKERIQNQEATIGGYIAREQASALKAAELHSRIELLQRAVEEIAKPLPSVPSAALAAGYKSQQLASQTLADIIKAVKP